MHTHQSLRAAVAHPLSVEQMMSVFKRMDFLAFAAPLILLSLLSLAYLELSLMDKKTSKLMYVIHPCIDRILSVFCFYSLPIYPSDY